MLIELTIDVIPAQNAGGDGGGGVASAVELSKSVIVMLATPAKRKFLALSGALAGQLGS